MQLDVEALLPAVLSAGTIYHLAKLAVLQDAQQGNGPFFWKKRAGCDTC